jgi:hypothetical protein
MGSGQLSRSNPNFCFDMQRTGRVKTFSRWTFVLLSFLFLLCSTARANEINYSAIGWWQIKYRTVDNLRGCVAEARFQDQTKIEMALIEQDNTKTWTFFLSNPGWNAWIRRKKQHTLIIAAVNPTRVWRDIWSTTDDNSLYLNASIDFMNQ